MKKIHHRCVIATFIFASFLTTSLWAQAPVVDDSENFALLDDEQQMANSPSVASRSHSSNNAAYAHQDLEQPLAHDNPTTANNNVNNAELLDKIQGLQQDLQELRGQLETQAHDVKTLQEQQLAFYKDLDARLQHGSPTVAQQAAPTAIETKPTAKAATDTATPSVTSESTPLTPAVQPNLSSAQGSTTDQQLRYLAAYELIQKHQYNEATSAMEAFLAHYPQSGYSANAQYWLGELYMVKKDYPNAMKHFDTVLKQYPSSSKLAASTLKMGYALAAAGQLEEAKQQLRHVIKNYPDTHTAALAAKKLKQLG